MRGNLSRFALVAVVAISTISFMQADDELDQVHAALAGQDAVDCGSSGVGEDRTAVDNCVVRALKSTKPFRARFDKQGIDSAISVGIIRTAAGQVFMTSYDSDPSGGQAIGPRVVISLCRAPRVSLVKDQERVTCPGHRD